MIGLKIQITDNTKAVTAAADKAAFKNFRHAAASISRDVKATFEKAPQGEASEPGEPPHTHRGTYIKRAIRYDADGEGAVIGPAASAVDQVGALHEFGGEYKGQSYPARPFMGPALERALPRFAGEWAGSIGT
jgi:phage gpG-like protein